jgi:phosphotransferase system HPr (HPr) family protein
MKLVECVQSYKATVWIHYQGQEFVVDSLLDLIALCIPANATITLKATGKEAAEVLEAVKGLEDFFGGG